MSVGSFRIEHMWEGDYQARIDRLVALRRACAALDAEQARILHALATDPPQVYPVPDPEGDKQWVREEVSCALQLAPVTAAAKLAEAQQLVECLPATLDLLAAGEITAPHAGRLVEATFGLDAKTTTAVEERVLKRAGEQTPSQFRASIRRAVLALAPRKREADRRAEAVAARRVVFSPQDDGTTELWALLPAETAAAIQAALATQADRLKLRDRANAETEQRTTDQRRADALTELIFGTTAVQPRVNVTVALSTLLSLDNQPGELDRHGPVPAALARALAYDPTGTWRRLLTDEIGQVLEVGPAYPAPPPPQLMGDRATTEDPTRPPRDERSRESGVPAKSRSDYVGWKVPAGRHAARAPARSGARDRPGAQRAGRDRTTHPAEESVRRLPDGTTRWRSPAGHICNRPPDEIPRDTTSDPPAAA